MLVGKLMVGTIPFHGLRRFCVNYETINQFHHFCLFAHHISSKYINYVTVVLHCRRKPRTKGTLSKWPSEPFSTTADPVKLLRARRDGAGDYYKIEEVVNL